MDTRWTKHLSTSEKRAEFAALVRNSTQVLGRLLEILEEDELRESNAELTTSSFDDPNWSYRQAFRLGDKSRIKKLKDLLSFLKGPR